ncbi:MAG: carboxymuconolactone decarboxylase family protein [candidate division NC10 bacterium]|nr:carboxymuconolactone decarboxylase family protein [candidate division NC10 bacterium]
MSKLPTPYQEFARKYKAVWKAYDELGVACHRSGPLPPKVRELVKLGMATGARMEGAVHSHTRRALEAGATAEEIRHAVFLAVTTLGFPTTMAVLTWVEDILRPRKASRARRR